MIIYLDESGDLGLNFERSQTSRYLVIGLLVFPGGVSHSAHVGMVRAVKRTLKSKLPKYTAELKGNKLSLPIKKYFLKEIRKESNWHLYMVIADKKRLLEYHFKDDFELQKKALYDKVAKKIFLHVEGIEKALSVDIIVDRSKNKNEIVIFDQAITESLSGRFAKNTRLSIKHRDSQEDPGLQAIDVFCSGVGPKYERRDLTWYKEFADKIEIEIRYEVTRKKTAPFKRHSEIS